MKRKIVVTGAASGIGKATAELLRSRGDTVIGVDLHAADVHVDLASAIGRGSLVDEVRELSGGSIDGILAIAGLGLPIPATVAVNYFGMIATLEGLRPLLAGSAAPRAVGIASSASIYPVDDELVAAMTAGDEDAALARAEVLSRDEERAFTIYASSKKAFAQWIRRQAPTAEWAGAGIPLNALAPGMFITPMTAAMLGTEEGRTQARAIAPMPLGDFADAFVPARLLAWLVSEENTHLCGQVIFIDGGTDAVVRGDSIW